MTESKGSLKNQVQDLGNQAGQAVTAAYENMKSAAENFSQRAQGFVTDASKRAGQTGFF